MALSEAIARKFADKAKKHPWYKKSISQRKQIAKDHFLKTLKDTNGRKVLELGEVAYYGYKAKIGEMGEGYDAMPLIWAVGYARNKDGVMYEKGINLHYFPFAVRIMILGCIEYVLHERAKITKSHGLKTGNKKVTNRNHKSEEHEERVSIEYKVQKGEIEKFLHQVVKWYEIYYGWKNYTVNRRQKVYIIPPGELISAGFTEGEWKNITRTQIEKMYKSFKGK